MAVNKPPGVLPVRNTSTALIATNPVFLYGQVIVETDTNRNKIGDGTSTYTQLTYSEWQYEIVEAAGTDTYTGTFSSPYFLAYFPLMRIRVRFTNANTGAATINLNGLGAKAIRKTVSAALVSGDFLAGGIYELCYDGTNFQVLGSTSAGSAIPTLTQVLAAGNTTGANNIVVTGGANRTISQTTGAQVLAVNFYQTYLEWYNFDGANLTYLDLFGNSFTINGGGSFPGAQYGANYSANYTARSLIDKGYADATYAATGSGVTSVNAATGVVVLTHTTAQGVSGIWTGTALALTLGALTGVTSLNGLVVTANTGVITTGTWRGTLVELAYGGTNANLTASLGGIFYSTAAAGAILAGTATAGQHLQSGASAAPSWTTATFPATATGTGTILRADGTNWVASTNTYPNTTPITQILYATSANVIGGNANFLSDGATMSIGTTLSTNRLINALGSANSSVGFTARNNTSGTVAFTDLILNTTTQLAQMYITSAGYTTVGGFTANQGGILGNGAGGFAIMATSATGFINLFTAGSAAANERIRILAAGEFIVGATALQGTELVSFTRNQNAATYGLVTNTTSGTAGRAYFGLTNTAGGGTGLFMVSHSAGFTTTGIQIADSASIFSNKTAGFNLGTFGAQVLSLWTNNTQYVSITSTGRTFFGGSTTATALVHIGAGTATASTAPLKFTSGTILTAAETGVHEYNGNHYLSNATTRFSIGGVLPFNNFADVSVGGLETDIYSATLLASTFNVNGDKVTAMYGGNFVTVGTELTQLKVHFAGTAIWDSTGVAPTTGTTSWRVTVELIRVSATVVRFTVSLNTTGASGFVYCTSGELAGLTLSNTNILKLTGTSSGVGSGVGDIVGKMGFVEIKPST